jgi:hypothetical protein
MIEWTKSQVFVAGVKVEMLGRMLRENSKRLSDK